VAQNIILH